VQSVAVTTTSDDGSDGGDDGGGDSGLDLGLVIGVAAGLAAAAGLLAVGVACMVVRRRRRTKRPNRAYEARLHDIHLAATSQRSFPGHGGFKQAAVTKQGARPLGGWAAGSSGSYSPTTPRRSPSAGMKTEDWLRAEQDEKRGLHTVPC
jgi:hypothetical protein